MPSGDSSDDGGWEAVANVRFQSEPGVVTPLEGEESDARSTSPDPVPPPAEFSEPDLSVKDVMTPQRCYVYGIEEQEQLQRNCESVQRNRDKVGGAASPASHTSDEGFVDKVEEPSDEGKVIMGGNTHTIMSPSGEPIIYDAVTPPSEYFTDTSKPAQGSQSETKIALEIRELKEREAELRRMREEREAAIKSGRAPVDEEDDDERETSSTSSFTREATDETLASFTTTTDEGNYSECGDHTSSEDKSSDGSNSRIMSPDLINFSHYGSSSTADHRQRKVTVKPFADEDVEEQVPVYARMKNESVIEREIRLAREREEAFRREKGLPNPSTASSISSASSSALSSPLPSGQTTPTRSTSSQNSSHSRVQADIEETAQRERELLDSTKIRTLSKDTVDNKVTRINDSEVIKREPSKSSTTPRPVSHYAKKSTPITNGISPKLHTPLFKRTSSPNMSSPYSPPSFTPSPTNRPPPPGGRLTRSFSTTNLSSGGIVGNQWPQKGLMQKFIASRGKLQTSAFAARPDVCSPLSQQNTRLFRSNRESPVTSNGVATRPMRVQSKTSVVNREPMSNGTSSVESAPKPSTPSKVIRRTYVTAEEKIQEELRDMKQREEELRRNRNLGRSHPNLTSLDLSDMDDDSSLNSPAPSEASEASISSSQLMDEGERSTQSKSGRRRSSLIAQWEGRIQQTQEI